MGVSSASRVAAASVAGAVAAAWAVAPAQAQEDTDTTTANIIVGGAITIADLDESFDIEGFPGDEAQTDDPVTFTVTTNNATGFNVTVQPDAAELTPADTENEDAIDFADLEVELIDDPGTFVSLNPAEPVEVYNQGSPTGDEGEDLAHNYELTIPFVQEDTYSGSITYVAAVNP